MKESKIKFNIVDILIILVLLVVLALGYIFVNNGASTTDSTEFTYDILFKEVPDEFVDAIQNGAAVFDGVKIIDIGNISNFTEKAAIRYEFNSQIGEYVQTEMPGKYDVTMKVLAKGVHDKLAYYVNDYEICIGKTVDVKSVGFVGHGVIIAVDEVK